MTRPAAGLLVVVGLLAGGTVAVSSVAAPAERRTAPQPVEIVGATAVCPDVRQTVGVFQTRVSVGAAPLPAGRTATAGRINGSLLTGGTSISIPVTQPGEVVVGLGTNLTDEGVVVSATGALAAGLEVEQVVRANDGLYRGLAGIRCEPPSRDSWFLGASTGLYDKSVLVLANVDDSAATVDVSVLARKGDIDPRPGQGMTIPPHTRKVVPLDSLAPDRDFLLVHVLSRQGRVVAALRDAVAIPGRPQGFDYVPQTLPPATTVVVPGIPRGPGQRWLLVANPSADDTSVSVRVTTVEDQFVPSGFDDIEVPAHRTKAIPITGLTDVSPLTATVTSTGAPVVAAVETVDVQEPDLTGIRELAFGSSALPLSGPALLTDLVINRPTESTLVLSAPEGAASVTVTPIRVHGSSFAPPAARTVVVPEGRTVVLRLSAFFPPGATARLAVEVRPQPGSGPVYATRYLRERGSRGPLSTLLTLQGPADTVSRPAAVQDDEAAYP